jgi:chromosome segregation ATPase
MTHSRILFAVLLCTIASAQAQSTLFRCVDDKGVTHYGETMPTACAKKDVTEISKQGRTIRKLEAPLTPEQQKAKAEADAKQRENDKKVAEQRQKDLAMLGTYSSEREIDVIRDKDLAQLEQRRSFLEARIADVEARLEKVNNQMAFYVAGNSKAGKAKDAKDAKDGKEGKSNEREVPPQLQSDFDRAKSDRANLVEEVTRLEADKKVSLARYEGEKERFRRLKSGMRPGTLLDEQGNVLVEAPIPKGASR